MGYTLFLGTSRNQMGGVPFMIHDGTGGMIIDPSLWVKKPWITDPARRVATGRLEMDPVGFGIGDPVYVLGDCVPATLTN